MSNPPFETDELEHWLSAYGADPKRWPEDKRAELEQLLARSPEVRRRFEQQQEVDAALDQLAMLEAPAQLRARVAQIPIRHPGSSRRQVWPFATVWKPALGLAAATVLGVVAGLQVPHEEPLAQATAPGFDDLSSVAFASHLTSEELP